MTERPLTPREHFAGAIAAGQFKPDTVARYRGRLARFEGKRVTLSLERERKHRSTNANAYLWALYGIAAEWCGHEPEELHEAMKARFLPAHEVALPTGELIQVPGSSAGLDTEPFSDFVSKVKRFFAEQGLYLPEPGEAFEVSA